MRKGLIYLFFIVSSALTLHGQSLPFSKAQWISPASENDTINRPCPVFQKRFHLKKQVASASLFITAHGIYEAQINGKRIGNGYFTPGFTAYRKRLQYQQYPIKSLLQEVNSIKVTIGDGWWRGNYGKDYGNNQYGNDASLLLQLDIQYTDGSRESITSDGTWQSTTGPIRSSDLYDGETYNANIKNPGWRPVKVQGFDKGNLVASTIPSVQKQEVFKPLRLIGDSIIDFGQNLAGWVKFRVSGKKGDTIRIAHAETLDKDGRFFTGNLRTAKATDTYILKGGGRETFEPHFTYHGFRYAKITWHRVGKQITPPSGGWGAVAIALHTPLKQTGTFSCSNPKLNQLQRNIEWSLNSNFFDIPTDCPQRSERLGWNLDAAVFCPTACYLRDVKGFYSKWLADLAAEQLPDGLVPVTIPATYGPRAAAGWSDAAITVPWTLYERYGDTAMLRRQYASMKAWIAYVKSQTRDDLWKAGGFGDWYAAGPKTPLPYLDQCYYYHCTELLTRIAKILNEQADVATYSKLLKNIKAAFDRNYAAAIPPTQTAYVTGLNFGLLPPSAIDSLVALIKANNNHIATGFMGTPYIMGVLSKYGRTHVAYTLLNQQDCPSWSYMVNSGATTMWEKWDAIKPDGTVQEMSLNHYAFGAIGGWLYEHVTGIQAAEPGYKVIRIAPEPGGGLTWAKGSYRCPYGLISVEWKIDSAQFKLHTVIPQNTTATIVMPSGKKMLVAPGTYNYSEDLYHK
ncbi:MAG: Alpha-L-rhamnosidase [Mucilaginibacter sp.]|nr:Alpha-L-rhamnosidase [Mucilaginibacter sp.]